MIPDWELWACAQHVLKQYGEHAGEHAERRVAELETAGDDEGVRTWRAIADRVEQLADVRGAGQVRH